MKILYTTDLHGRDLYYTIIRKKALDHKVDMVINGGDILPKAGKDIFKAQRKYIRHLKDRYFPLFEKAKIHYLFSLGNDDMRIYDHALNEACSQFEYIHNIAGKKIEIDGYDFIGFNLVPDYPFGIKDRCRMDTKDFVFPKQLGSGYLTTENGWEELEDWFALAKSLPTIEDELKALVRPKNKKKAVYVMHMPPAGLGLDVSQAGDRPSSKAITEFLLKEQPLLSLHGHFHESYIMTGIWKAPLGETICVQPGQGGKKPAYVLIDTDTMEMERYGHNTETLMINAYKYCHKGGGIKYIRISELPEYLIKPFNKWHRGQTMINYPGEKTGDTPYSHDFRRFCDRSGIKIKFILKKK